MKCIKDSDGNVTRVNDNTAKQAVRSGKVTYTSKSEWKDKGRKRGMFMR